jgi:hypothetical protein
MYYYVFCDICGRCCDFKYEEGVEFYVCEEHGEVKGIQSEGILCIGCDNFDEIAPFFKDKDIDGCCDYYWGMSFKMFKRKKKCKHFEVRYD